MKLAGLKFQQDGFFPSSFLTWSEGSGL